MKFRLTAATTTLSLSLLLSGPLLAKPDVTNRQEASVNEYSVLGTEEAADLTFMREEEKMARDVYDYLYTVWNNSVFDNISNSEQQHLDTMGDLLDKYQLPDPVQYDQPGIFMNVELQSLYIDLVNMGNISELAALKAGALIEETDMVDIVDAIEDTDNSDIQQAYEELLRGSRNHLRAYVSQIEASGEVYEAQVLSQEEVDAIVDSPMERGGRR